MATKSKKISASEIQSILQ